MIKAKTDLKIVALYKTKLSAANIAEKLNLSIHQVYGSLQRQNVLRRSRQEQNKIRFEKSPLSFNFKEKYSNKDKQLLIAGLMLYYGEGAKTGTTVDFANSDPMALEVFLNFLRTICRIDENKLRLYLYCFSDQDPNELIDFWSRRLKVLRSSFTKPYIRSSIEPRYRRMLYGVLHIRYSDKRLLEKILFLCSSVLTKLSK